MDRIMRVQAFYEDYFLSSAGGYPELAILYGWLACASLLAGVVLLLFVLFKRESAKGFVGAFGQHILLLGVPWLVAPLMNALNL